MTSNIFLFREEYDQQEKIDRIPANAFSTSSNVVSEFIEEKVSGEFDINELTKEKTIARLRTATDSETFDTFIDELFENEGKKGDSFNLRMFEIPKEIDGQRLKQEAESLAGDSVSKDIDGTMTTLELDEVNHQFDSKVPYVDLRFVTPVEQETFNPDEETPVEIVDNSGHQVAYSDDPRHTVNILSNQTIEARVYTNLNTVLISNSEVKKNHQNAVTLIVAELGTSSGKNSDSDEDIEGEENES